MVVRSVLQGGVVSTGVDPWTWRMVALAVFAERSQLSIRAKLDKSLRPECSLP